MSACELMYIYCTKVNYCYARTRSLCFIHTNTSLVSPIMHGLDMGTHEQSHKRQLRIAAEVFTWVVHTLVLRLLFVFVNLH